RRGTSLCDGAPGVRTVLQILVSERQFLVICCRIRQSCDIAASGSTIIAILSDGLLRTGLEVCLARKGPGISQFSKSMPAARNFCWLIIAS
ncbi:MAG: hypothetical protein ABL931_02485, partial [Usitatibacteraceae bacterium]